MESYDVVDMFRLVDSARHARSGQGFLEEADFITTYCNDRAREGWRLKFVTNVDNGRPSLMFFVREV